ncbi:aminoglycoside phosphotransferase family protein [Kocuria sp. CPCC 205235]|uniref:phosphotransferase family protein n=1 Tax=Kocuria sp. CPCC 205235 TaxID=3073549 RepID=UPI0034D4132F
MRELQIISEVFPDLSWTRTQRITDGWDHVVVILDGALVFRFPIDPAYLHSLRTEIDVLNFLADRLTARIPRYNWVAPDHSFAGYPLLPGRPLTVAEIASLTPEATVAASDQLADFLSSLHSLPIQGTPLGRVPPTDLAQDRQDVLNLVRKHLRLKMTPFELATIDRILHDVEEIQPKNHISVLIHNDLYSSHLLWDSTTSRLGVIDFSDMCIGEPAMDFSRLFEFGPSMVEAVYSKYAGPKDSTFLDRAWTYWEWYSVYSLTDHFEVGRTTWSEARQCFDQVIRPTGEDPVPPACIGSLEGQDPLKS